MLGDVEETIYIVSDDEDDDTVRVSAVLDLKEKQMLMWNGRE